MPFAELVKPGQRLTAGRLNRRLAIGAAVFVAYRDAGQTITSTNTGSAANALSWDNVSLDLLGGWDSGDPTRWTPTEPGRYWCTGSVGFDANGDSGSRGCAWRQNGDLPEAASVRIGNISGENPVVNATALAISFDGSSDYIELCPQQESGSSLDTATGSNRPSITILYLGPD